MQSNFTIAVGQKFALASLRGTSVDLTQPMQLAADFWLSPSPPVDAGSVWTQWLGTLSIEDVAKANFFIVSAKQAVHPELLDNENEDLEAMVLRFFYGMLFIGVPQYSASSLLSGANVDGVPSVRQFGALDDYHIAQGAEPHTFSRADFERAGLISEALRSIYAEPSAYLRLRRGVNAYLKALREEQTYHRIHQLVRSLEALILPSKGKTKEQFKKRCQLFTHESPSAAFALGEAYELRSRVEHLRDWDDILPAVVEDKRHEVFSYRVRQLEALARFAYARILTTPSLLAHFESSLSLAKFWGKDFDVDRRILWGEQLDITLVS